MQYINLPGLTKPVARLAQGTTMIRSDEAAGSLKLLDGIFALGGNTFDTAHGYRGGDSERTLGRWMETRGNREQVVIISKGAHPNADRKRRVTPFDITADLHDSLARLRTSYIDIYLLHRDDPAVPVSVIVDCLNEHWQAGRIRLFGGSNWTHERIQEANAYAAACGLQPFSFSSPHFSLAEQVQPPWEGCITITGPAGAAARAWYAETQLPLVAWSSLASGFFSGRVQRDNLAALTGDLAQVCAHAYGYAGNFERLERAEVLARARGATAAQVALAYALHQPLNLIAVVGCETEAEFAENQRAFDLSLTPDELAWLETGAPVPAPRLARETL